MKMIVLGDIHANLPALEVCFAEAEKEGYDLLVHTGDVVGYGPFPRECLEFLDSRGIKGVRGNFDENIGWGNDTCGPTASLNGDSALAQLSFEWTARQMGIRDRRWLSDLPFELRIGRDGRRLAVYHASPVSLGEWLHESTSDYRLMEYADEAAADVVIVGHVHRCVHRRIGACHFVNAGSVGRLADDEPRTGYAVIETGPEIRVAFRRFAYDAERTVAAIKARGLPEELGLLFLGRD